MLLQVVLGLRVSTFVMVGSQATIGDVATYTEPIVVEMAVEPGAAFLGCTVKDLGLPPGCILMQCHLNGHECVPMAATILEEQMRITAAIASEAADTLALLRRGCEASEH